MVAAGWEIPANRGKIVLAAYQEKRRLTVAQTAREPAWAPQSAVIL